jgi:hypothetical protein
MKPQKKWTRGEHHTGNVSERRGSKTERQRSQREDEMITNYSGGEVAPSGVYWNRTRGEFVSFSGEGELAGDRSERYLRAPLPVVLIVGPLMGLAYFAFLPLSGLMVLVPFLAGKLRDVAFPARLSAAHMAAPQRLPGVSYLEPQSRTPEARVEQEGWLWKRNDDEGKLVDLATEIARRLNKN